MQGEEGAAAKRMEEDERWGEGAETGWGLRLGGRKDPVPSPEIPSRGRTAPITTLSSPWKMGMNLSPRRISA